MSAFLCGKDHIDLLVSYCADQWFHNGKWSRLSDMHRREVGDILIAQNITSLRCRYTGVEWWATEDAWYDNYTHTPVTEMVSPEQIINACDCFRYQSCEDPAYMSSEAHAIIRATRERHIGMMLRRNPDLMWEWSRKDTVNV